MPGDNGDWSSYDQFLTTIISDIRSNFMTRSLDIKIWNEPDLPGIYWQRSIDQYLQMWGRAYARMKRAFPFNKIVGPTFSASPTIDGQWWNAFCDFVGKNGSVPDQYAWHVEGDPNSPDDDLQTNMQDLQPLLQKYGLPSCPININEYGGKNEQRPESTAWFISRFERYDVLGLRGRWAAGYQLHDFFASLLGKPNASGPSYDATQGGYWGNGEYNVYKYYATNMTGKRLTTTGSGDGLFDIYATAGNNPTSLKMLCGFRNVYGLWQVEVRNLSTLGTKLNGTVSIQTIHFNYDGGEDGNVPYPAVLGWYDHTYSDDVLSFPVGGTDERAFAFEFAKVF